LQHGRTFTDFCCERACILLELCLDLFGKQVIQSQLREEWTILIIESVAFDCLPHSSHFIIVKFLKTGPFEHAFLICNSVFAEEFLCQICEFSCQLLRTLTSWLHWKGNIVFDDV
jgi:hypothetical protein